MRWPSGAILHLAVSADVTMGFALGVPGVLEVQRPQAAWISPLIGLGYATGFLILVLGREQSFTETTWPRACRCCTITH